MGGQVVSEPRTVALITERKLHNAGFSLGEIRGMTKREREERLLYASLVKRKKKSAESAGLKWEE